MVFVGKDIPKTAVVQGQLALNRVDPWPTNWCLLKRGPLGVTLPDSLTKPDELQPQHARAARSLRTLLDGRHHGHRLPQSKKLTH